MTLHHFSDAFEEGYGLVSYLKFVDTENKIHCVFVMGKSRVARLKFVSIPRLELTAATLSVKVSKLIREELQHSINKEYFWTDGQVVLGYLQNQSNSSKYLWQTGSRSSNNILMWVSGSMFHLKIFPLSMHQEELLETRDIKSINDLMVQVFFGKTKLNGLLQQKFQRLAPMMILKSEGWQLSIWLAKNKIFCEFWSHEFQAGWKWKEGTSDVVLNQSYCQRFQKEKLV